MVQDALSFEGSRGVVMYKKPDLIITPFPDYYLFSYRTPSGEVVVIGRYSAHFSLDELTRFAERKLPVLYFPDDKEDIKQ